MVAHENSVYMLVPVLGVLSHHLLGGSAQSLMEALCQSIGWGGKALASAFLVMYFMLVAMYKLPHAQGGNEAITSTRAGWFTPCTVMGQDYTSPGTTAAPPGCAS